MNRIEEITVDGEAISLWLPYGDCDAYQISMASGGWLPGSYDSKESAILGVKAIFTDEASFVCNIQGPVNHFQRGNRLISESDFKQTTTL